MLGCTTEGELKSIPLESAAEDDSQVGQVNDLKMSSTQTKMSMLQEAKASNVEKTQVQ